MVPSELGQEQPWEALGGDTVGLATSCNLSFATDLLLDLKCMDFPLWS